MEISMSNIVKLNSISQLYNFINQKSEDKLFAVIDFSKIENPPKDLPKLEIGFYTILLKDQNSCNWKYGINKYDFHQGALVFLAPGQVLEVTINPENQNKQGIVLLFHPDLLIGSNLKIDGVPEYSFFSYDVNEALYLNNDEKKLITDFFDKIESFNQYNLNQLDKKIVVSYIELILNYSYKFYDRQFKQNKKTNHDIISKFDQFLNSYLNSELLSSEGVPTVSFCADNLNLSSNYLSDLLKKETGKTTMEHIHYKIIDKAKLQLSNTSENIRQVAYSLGFEYPQYFHKLFKKLTGISPKEFKDKIRD
jgi:AraC-like DNA-binding protein